MSLVYIAHVCVSGQYPAALWIKKARDQACQRRLAAAGGADEGGRLPGPYAQRDIRHRVPLAVVAVAGIFDVYGAVARMRGRGAFGKRARRLHIADAF